MIAADRRLQIATDAVLTRAYSHVVREAVQRSNTEAYWILITARELQAEANAIRAHRGSSRPTVA